MDINNIIRNLKAAVCSFFHYIYQFMNKMAKKLNQYHITANQLTFSGLLFSLLGLNFIAIQAYFLGGLCLIGNRICDILDGQLARLNGITRFGAFMDIFADYTTQALFIFGFVLANPQDNAAAGAFMLAVLTISAAALLGYTAIAGLNFKKLNQSSLIICAWGTLQNFDYFIAFILMCLLPKSFTVLAILFALISLGKTLILISSAYYNLVIIHKGKKR